jgi:hypothetical protein
MELKHAGLVAPNHPAGPALQKASAHLVARGQQSLVSFEADQPMEPRVAPAVVDEARSQVVPARKANKPAALVYPGPSGAVVVNPPDVFGLAEEEVGRLEKKKKANNPVFEVDTQRARQEADVVSSEVQEKRIQTPLPSTQEAVAQDSEARLAAALAQQANQALELFSPFADAAERSMPTREASGPQVHIGTIEVIVESAPVAQQKPSPGIGFTRDLGRSYQRRL